MRVGPCAKTQVRCTLTAPLGETVVGENVCLNPQPRCPRAPGEGYEKCKTVCQQIGHAEEVAVAAAGPLAKRAEAVIEGHTHVCGDCLKTLREAGVGPIRVQLPLGI